MGTTTSNVLQECLEEDDIINMEYMRGGILTSIPDEVKPRPKIGRNPKTTNKSNSKIKNDSLRSALSVELDNPEAEKIRKEFEMFKLNKENELANFKRKEKKLETENRKLKTELQALQKTCKKLRDERDHALDAEQRALMRAAAIESDRDKVQRQFKIFRETKESELQNLLKVRRILESKIMKVDPTLLEVDHLPKDDDANETWMASDTIVGLYPPVCANRRDDIEAQLEGLGDRWHGDQIGLRSDQGDHLRNCSDIVTVCWFPGGNDPHEMEEEELFQEMATRLEECCQQADHLFNFLKIHPQELTSDHGEVVAMATKIITLTTGSYFAGFIFTDISTANSSHLKLLDDWTSLSLPIHILASISPSGGHDCGDDDDLGKDDDDDNGGGDDNDHKVKNDHVVEDFKHLKRVMERFKRKKSNSSSTLSIHHSTKDLCLNLEKIIHKKLQSKHLKEEFDCLSFLGWDDIWLWQDWQEQLFHHYNSMFHHHHHHGEHNHNDRHHHHISDDLGHYRNGDQNHHRHHHGDLQQHHHHHHWQHHVLSSGGYSFSWFDKYLSKITSHVSSAGPIPPLLIEGVECSGKTTLLMKWIDQYRARCPPCFVVFYSVLSSSHPSCDSTVLLKCLMFQIMQCFSTPFALVPDPVHLVRDFPKWLEKVSTMFPGGVVLLLDSIDRVKNFEVVFDWLMDPLPVDLRVIVSLRSDACPPSWRSWPLLSINPMMENEVREYVDLLAEDWLDFSKDVVLTHLLDNPSLCLPLSAYLVAVISMLSPDGSNVLSNCRILKDLYVGIIDILQEILGAHCTIRKYLAILSCSRQGLTLSQLMEVTNGRSEVNSSNIEVMDLMIGGRLLKNMCGSIMVENELVMSALNDLPPSANKDDETSAMKELARHHLTKLKTRQTTTRSILEITWISMKLQDWETLKVIVNDLELCLTFLKRGLGLELVDYWRYLNFDLSMLALKLDLKLQEYEQNLENVDNCHALLAVGYEAVGRFLTDQGNYEEALNILHRCIELHHHNENDHHVQLKLGRVSNLLGHIHDKLGRRSVTEAMYLNALSHFECLLNPLEQQDINNNNNDDDDKGDDNNDGHDDDGDDNNDGHDDDGDSEQDGTNANEIKSELNDDEDDGMDHFDDDAKTKYRYHHLVAAQLDLLASLHLKQGRVEMSDNFLKRASRLRSRVNEDKKNDIKVLKHTESMEQRIQELTASHRSGHLDELSLAGVEHELGKLYALMGQHRDAEVFLNWSLIKRESVLPSDHQLIVQSLNSLLAFYGQSKQFNKVEELSERLLQSVEKTQEHNMHLALGTLKNLVYVSRYIGRLDKFEIFSEMLLNVVGHDSLSTPKDIASALVNLAVAYSQQGKHSKADLLYKQALDTYRDILPPNDSRVIETTKNLALSTYEQGNFEEAAQLYLLAIKGNETRSPYPPT